jgi:hypothetical protein
MEGLCGMSTERSIRSSAAPPTGRPMAAAMARPSRTTSTAAARIVASRKVSRMLRRVSRQIGPLERLFSSLAQTSVRMSAETLQGRPPCLKAPASAMARGLRVPSGSPRISLLVLLVTATTPGSGTEQAE